MVRLTFAEVRANIALAPVALLGSRRAARAGRAGQSEQRECNSKAFHAGQTRRPHGHAQPGSSVQE